MNDLWFLLYVVSVSGRSGTGLHQCVKTDVEVGKEALWHRSAQVSWRSEGKEKVKREVVPTPACTGHRFGQIAHGTPKNLNLYCKFFKEMSKMVICSLYI